MFYVCSQDIFVAGFCLGVFLAISLVLIARIVDAEIEEDKINGKLSVSRIVKYKDIFRNMFLGRC